VRAEKLDVEMGEKSTERLRLRAMVKDDEQDWNGRGVKR